MQNFDEILALKRFICFVSLTFYIDFYARLYMLVAQGRKGLPLETWVFSTLGYIVLISFLVLLKPFRLTIAVKIAIALCVLATLALALRDYGSALPVYGFGQVSPYIAHYTFVSLPIALCFAFSVLAILFLFVDWMKFIGRFNG